MKRLLGPVLLLSLAGVALEGCRRKVPTAEVAATPAPTAEAMSPSGAPPTPSPLPIISPAVQKSLEASGTSAELAATDAAYEAWFKKYHLDLNDPSMLSADPDGDGFNNSEEFIAGTDPLQADSHPGVHQSMKMKDFTKVELPFVLRSVEGGVAQIERTDDGEHRVEKVRAGQTLSGSPYRVAAVRSRQTRDKDGNPMDASNVILENPTSREKVDLVRDLPARSPASYAVLTSPDGTQTMTVHLHDRFYWPNEPAVEYVVKDLRAEQVILEQEGTGQMWTVRKE